MKLCSIKWMVFDFGGKMHFENNPKMTSLRIFYVHLNVLWWWLQQNLIFSTLQSFCFCRNYSLPCKLVLAEPQNIASYLCHYFTLVLRSPVLQDVLDHVVSILVLNKTNHGNLIMGKVEEDSWCFWRHIKHSHLPKIWRLSERPRRAKLRCHRKYK